MRPPPDEELRKFFEGLIPGKTNISQVLDQRERIWESVEQHRQTWLEVLKAGMNKTLSNGSDISVICGLVLVEIEIRRRLKEEVK